MKKSTRTLLFFSLLVIFLITAPSIIAYSQGYRVDWGNRAFVKTGAIFLEPRPAPVKLYIDGKLRRRSNFVFQNIFIGDLLPKNYLIGIQKEGYQTWQKNLPVLEKLVTEAKNLMLFPENPKTREIKTEVQSFFPSPSGKYITVFNNNKNLPATIYNTENDEEKKITFPYATELSKALWNENSEKIIISPKDERIETTWIVPDILSNSPKAMPINEAIKNTPSFARASAGMLKPVFSDFKWSESSPTLLFFIMNDAASSPLKQKDDLLFAYDIKTDRLSDSLAQDVFQYDATSDEVVYFSSILGSINIIHLASGEIKQLSFSPLVAEQDLKRLTANKIKISAQNEGNIIVSLRTNNSASKDKFLWDTYLYNKDLPGMEIISRDNLISLVSKDGKKILFLKDGSVESYWLSDIRVQPFRNKGDRETILKAGISNIAWFSKDNEHIIFSDQNKLAVIELDYRGGRNENILSNNAYEHIYYSETQNAVYALNGSTLHFIDLGK